MMRRFTSDRLKASCMTRIPTLLSSSSSSPSLSSLSLHFVNCDVICKRTAYNGASQGGINSGNLNWGNNSFIDPSHYANLRTNNSTKSDSTFSKKIDTWTDDKIDKHEPEHIGNFTFNTETFLTDNIDSKPENIKTTTPRYSHHPVNNNNDNNSNNGATSEQGNAQVDVKTNTNNTRDQAYRETGINNPNRGFAGIPMKPQGSTFTDANSNVSARRNPLHSSATSHSHQNVLHESTMHMSSKVSNHKDKSAENKVQNNNNINDSQNIKNKVEEQTADVDTFTAPHRLNDHVFHKTSHPDEENGNNNCKKTNTTQGFGSVPYTQDGNQFKPTNDDAKPSEEHQHQDHRHANNNNSYNNTKKGAAKTSSNEQQKEQHHQSKMDSVGSFTISSHAATKSTNTHDHQDANTQKSTAHSKANTKHDDANLYNNDHTYTDANGNKMENASHNYNPTTPSHHDKSHDNKGHNGDKKREKKSKQ